MIKSQNTLRKAMAILTVEKVEDMEMVWGRLSTKTGGKGTESLKFKGRRQKLSIMDSFGAKISFVIVDNFSYRK